MTITAVENTLIDSKLSTEILLMLLPFITDCQIQDFVVKYAQRILEDEDSATKEQRNTVDDPEVEYQAKKRKIERIPSSQQNLQLIKQQINQLTNSSNVSGQLQLPGEILQGILIIDAAFRILYFVPNNKRSFAPLANIETDADLIQGYIHLLTSWSNKLAYFRTTQVFFLPISMQILPKGFWGNICRIEACFQEIFRTW